MKLKDRIQEGVVVIEPSGRILSANDSTLFQGKILEYINLKKRDFVIDLANVELSNSEGLRMLVGAHLAVQRTEGRLVLANIDRIKELLILTKIILLFDVYDSLQDARASFTHVVAATH